MDSNFARSLVSDAGIRARPGGVDVDVRLPWYRAMPLSIVEVASLTIDGQPVPPEAIGFEINGKTHPLAALPELTGEVWYVLDAAVLHVAAPFAAGSEHRVELTLNLYPAYIPGLTWVTRAAATYRPH